MRVAFRHAGLAHVLALSGMHLSLVGASATFLGRFIGTRHRGMQGAFFA
ncbi:ComEC/Rec2 family competence protein, partial [Treponema pallidum]